jgi:hypothetical protein
MGVSICLDRESRSRVSISTSSKSESWQSRKSWQRQKVSLDDQDISIETSQFRLDINVQTKKSRSRSRNLSRSENFGVSQQFVLISIEKCVDFCISRQDFSIRRDFSSFSDSKDLDNVEISRQISTASWKILKISTNLDNFDGSQQSRQKSQRVKVSTEKSRPRKKKVDLDHRENLDNSKKLVLTRRTFSILISIGLDCRDPCLCACQKCFIILFKETVFQFNFWENVGHLDVFRSGDVFCSNDSSTMSSSDKALLFSALVTISLKNHENHEQNKI